MKRATWSAITVLLGVLFGNSPIGHSQPTILIAPELKPHPPEPVPPSPITSFPKPPKVSLDDIRAVKKPPFPIPDKYEIRECLDLLLRRFLSPLYEASQTTRSRVVLERRIPDRS